jgi:hypothetical protein
MRKIVSRATSWLGLPALLVLSLAVSRAQTVTPVINELGNPAKGHVEYVNGSDMPLTVVLEARSFTVSETGEVTYRPLDPEIHLKLSTSSFRIQPQQRFYVFYEASASKSPAWFVIYASFSGFPFRTAQGMNVRVLLPHTVYLLPKQQVEQHDIRIVRAEVNPSAGKAVIEVENAGDNFGRVLETQLVYTNRKQQAPGFPVFPHAKRILEVPLEGKGQTLPTEVNLEFQKFKVTEKLQPPPPAAGSSASLAEARVTR